MIAPWSLSLTAMALGVVLVAAGCGSSAPPPTSLGSAQAAVAGATARGADNFAEPQLRLAGEKLTAAEAAAREEENERAELLAREALINVRLARVLAEAERAKAETAAMEDALATLRREAERGPAPVDPPAGAPPD